MPIKSKTILDGKIAIIELRGSLIGDEGTAEFRAEVSDFIEQGNKNLIINLEKVNYINSSGIGALIAAHASYVNNGGEVLLTGASRNIQNLFAITKLVEVFKVHDRLDDAIETFKKEINN